MLNNSSSDPDEWFIELDPMQSMMMAIDPAFKKKGDGSHCKHN
jgi:hypothetical protein